MRSTTERKPGGAAWRNLALVMALSFSLALGACSDNVTGTPNSTQAPPTATTQAGGTTSGNVATVTPGGAATTSAGQLASATTAATTATGPASSTTTAAAPALTDQQESNTVVGVVQRVSPAVVTIYNKASRSTSTSGSGQITRSTGSGVIISEDGYIITNAHVVQGEQGLTVAFNNGQSAVSAKVVGTDTDGDIAVIKVDGKVPAFAKFGDSDKLQVGETVVAIGAALGDYRNSVTKGVVSGLNRTIPGDSSQTVYIQTDAPINHGNSGGPLLNLAGEIIGINTAVVRSTTGVADTAPSGASDLAEGLAFAIPSNTAKFLSDQLVSKGSVTRPYFGIRYQMITPALAGTSIGSLNIPAVEGAWISGTSRQPGIVSGGPAEKAGLKENDVITAINGVPLNDANPLVNAVLKYKPSDTLTLTVVRGSQTLTLPLTLGERPKQ